MFKRMIATILIIGYVCVLCCVGSAESYNEEVISYLKKFSVSKAAELISTVSQEEYKERYMIDLDTLLQKMIVEIEADVPDYMFVLSTPQNLDLNAVFEEYAISSSMGATFCFDVIYDANSVYITDDSFAEWSDRSSIYDVIDEIEGYPPVIYTVLVYSENTPQVVTAFFQINETSYITKTALVYNVEIEPDSIYAAFPYVALNIWGDLDSLTIDLRE